MNVHHAAYRFQSSLVVYRDTIKILILILHVIQLVQRNPNEVPSRTGSRYIIY